jgi:hypothetical protein
MTSAGLSVRLGQPVGTASLTLVASPNPTVVGQDVVLTATAPWSAATGDVAFYDGANLLGHAALANGQAVFRAQGMGTGEHVLQAVYGGDGFAFSSRSANVIEIVAGEELF